MVTYTSSSTYWAPLKPRIRIYAFNDSSYSSPLYTYNPFTDVGTTTKPLSLTFDSQTTNAGSFSVEIEDRDTELDADTFTKGNRVFIDCSKDGSTFQPAFKGLVRSSEQIIYAPTGRNFTLSGYSYLVRLNERILNVVKESALSGTDYDRTDSTMFTNNLIEDLLTTDSNYVSAADDRALYNLPNPANISSSAITDWIPRLDAELVTVGSAIDTVLEYSNSLITVDLSNDEWVIYNPEQTTSLTQSFLITDNMLQVADDADITMYPLAPYKYNVSYDYPDSGSRLIVALNTGGTCPEIIDQPTDSPCTNVSTSSPLGLMLTDQPGAWISGQPFVYENTILATEFKATQTDMSNLRLELACGQDISSVSTSAFRAQVRAVSGGNTNPGTGSQIGSDMILYKDRTPGTTFPNFMCCSWFVGLERGDTGVTGLTIGTNYWLLFWSSVSLTGFTTIPVKWLQRDLMTPDSYRADINFNWPTDGSSEWGSGTSTGHLRDPARNGPLTLMMMDFGDDLLQEQCGGSLTTTEIPEPQFVVAHDLNATNRLGIVERAITSLPRHITTLQTINEYLYAKLYVSAKPRFTFDYPSVSVPGKIPKAGDIVTHVAGRAGVGLMGQPLQTGVIMSVSYDFAQGDDGSLGLRKMGLQTTGIRRGSY